MIFQELFHLTESVFTPWFGSWQQQRPPVLLWRNA